MCALPSWGSSQQVSYLKYVVFVERKGGNSMVLVQPCRRGSARQQLLPGAYSVADTCCQGLVPPHTYGLRLPANSSSLLDAPLPQQART